MHSRDKVLDENLQEMTETLDMDDRYFNLSLSEIEAKA